MAREAGSEARGQEDQISEPWLLQSGLSFLRSGLSFLRSGLSFLRSGLSFLRSGLSFLRSGLSFGFRNSDVTGDLVRAVLVILLTLLLDRLTDLVRWAQKESRKKGADSVK